MNKNPKNSIIEVENNASETIWPEIQDHINYLTEVYNLSFEFQFLLNGRTFHELGNSIRAQLLILMRITEFVRSIQLLAAKGYPEQAGTLTASIFELAHTAFLFSYDEDAAKKWLIAKSTKERIPKLFGFSSWEFLIKKNYEHLNLPNYNSEYDVYRKLCWMKHSHPLMQDFISYKNGVTCRVAPHYDDLSINHSWYSMENAGRLASLVLHTMLIQHPNVEISKKAKDINKIREALRKKAVDKFGNKRPLN